MRKKDTLGTNDLQYPLPFVCQKPTWAAPSSFPDLDGAKILGFDTETRDPHLTERGPGFLRGEAEVVGVSLSTTDASWYFPIGHLGGGNMDRESVLRFLGGVFRNPDCVFIGANTKYDLEGLDSLSIPLPKKVVDIQIAEALLDEELPSYSLDALTRRYCGHGKNEGLLRQSAEAFGVHPKHGLWKLHAGYVGPYAEADARDALSIYKAQSRLLEDEGLLVIADLEFRLIPLIYQMRKLGLRVDLDSARELHDDLLSQESAISAELIQLFGLNDPWSGPKIARVCDRLGIQYPRTDKGSPSFAGAWLDSQDHALFVGISRLREVNRLRSTFIKDWIFGNEKGGIIHPDWNQLRRDEGGTRTGRMSSSNPNCQQVPARSEIGAKIRKLFIPRDGKKWAKIDYSQQEPRLLVHYAALCGFAGAREVADAYRNNRDMDIYQHLSESCGMTRRDAKNATLGRCYGMGVELFASGQGLTLEEARRKLDSFDRSVPFVKEIANFATSRAEDRGYVITLGGRKRHFNFWEPRDAYDRRKRKEIITPLRYEEARERWPGIPLKRAWGHKALNSLIQGSAADMTKTAMLQVWEKHGLVPYSQVHDELNYGVDDEEQARAIKHVMETCIPLEVPVIADLQLGDTWK